MLELALKLLEIKNLTYISLGNTLDLGSVSNHAHGNEQMKPLR
jgi:hypothetical protein